MVAREVSTSHAAEASGDAAPPQGPRLKPWPVLVLVAVAAALVAGGIAWLRGPDGPTVYVDLSQAPGGREGTVVRFRGLEVGRVEQIRFVPAGLRLTVVLTRDDVPLRAGDRVRAVPMGIFGDVDLVVVPGPETEPLVRPGAVLGEAPPDTAALRRQAAVESALAAFKRELGARDSIADSGERRPPR